MINQSFTGLLAAVLLTACAEKQAEMAPSDQAATVPHPPLPVAQPEQAVATENIHAGEVLAVLSGGGYTYLEVEAAGGRLWLASNQVVAEVGQHVQWGDYAVMRDFHSDSLDRNFPEILFVASVAPSGAFEAEPRPQSGVASQVIAAAGYIYIQVEAGGRKLWLAAPGGDIAVGDPIYWQGGSVMRGFYSRSLDRNFEEILFVAAVSKASAL